MEALTSAAKSIAGLFLCMDVSGIAMHTVDTPRYHKEIVLLGWRKSRETRLGIVESQILCEKAGMPFM
jgi:hypothetical protein